ncbi:MAG: hypothetical protein M3Z22_08570, partial [Verrucomicrobiota bacterium]|nr:hypothetical protein [Verrucomicrobiota bacterium]
ATRDRNIRTLNKVIAAQSEFSAEFCAHYFRDCLRFGFGSREEQGLWKFRSLCEKHGILPVNRSPLRLV